MSYIEKLVENALTEKTGRVHAELLGTRWVIPAIVLVIIGGAGVTFFIEKKGEVSARQSLLERAQTMAAAIDQGELHALDGSPADLAKPDYAIIKDTMLDLHRVNPDTRFVYLTGVREDKLFFIADSEPPESKDYSAPGDVYAQTTQEQLDHFAAGTNFVQGPYTDAWGEWVTGWAPLVDDMSGKTIAMLGMDIPAAEWYAQARSAMQLPIVLTLALVLLLALYLYFARRGERYIEQLQASEEKLAAEEKRLRTLYNITTNRHAKIAEQFRSALAVGNTTLQTRMAMVNRIEGGTFTILYAVVPPDTVHEGDSFKLEETYCDITVKSGDVLAISAMGVSQYKAHVCYSKFKLESYIGVPVKVSGQLFGTLTFLAPDPHRPEFSESDKDFVRLMGAWMSAALEREEIDRMKSEFVSVASHQLRTPLTGIKWFAELMLAGKAGDIGDKQKEFLQDIHSSNERMIKLVEDLLNVSRIESGSKFIITKVPTDIVAIIKSLATDLVGLAHAHQVEIKNTIAATTFVVPIDADKMRQVFANLMSNAVKYSNAGGVVEVGMNKKDGMAEFFVKDSGLGIPKDAQSKMFQKFFRAENVQTKETDGTGLGLYIAKAIVEGHGGKIWFESEENKGTTFFVSLPKNYV